MSERFLKITLQNEDVWHVPARVIAEARADYYATEVDGHAKGSPEYVKEVEYALSKAGSYDLEDYFRNNMDWTDVERVAKRVRLGQPKSMNEELSEAEFEVVDA